VLTLVIPDCHRCFQKKFDVVCVFEVLEHLDEVYGLLKNVYALMSRNSRLLVSISNLASFLTRLSLLLGNQPHILEASSMYLIVGIGILGDLN